MLVVLGATTSDEVVGRFEEDLFRLANSLPSLLGAPLIVLMQAGSGLAIPAAVTMALALHRRRLARDLAVAGVFAWLLADAAKGLLQRPRPAGLLPEVDVRLPDPGGYGFPSGHVSIATALVTAAWPHLPPRPRAAAAAVAVTVGLARVYSGVHLPWDVVGGAGLGVAVGAAVHLLLGAPSRRHLLADVGSALERAGLTVVELEVRPPRTRGSTTFLATTADGEELFVKAVGRAQRAAVVLGTAGRPLLGRRPGVDVRYLTPKRSVRQEAHLSRLAEQAGVRTPPVVTSTGTGPALVVHRRVQGRSLAGLAPTEVTPALLGDLWAQVARLHAARIAHRDLRAASVLVDDDARPWLVGFGTATEAADERWLSSDVAELLTATAAVAGAEPACRAACDGVGPDAVAAALPRLHPSALTRQTRRQAAARPGLLDEVRTRAADAAGVTAPTPARTPRPRLRWLLFVLVGGVGIYLLLPSLGGLSTTVDAARDARWGWLGAAVAASATGFAAAAVELAGAANRRPPPLPAVGAQLAAAFVNRFTPAGVGAIAVNTRFLMRSGLDGPAAAAAVTLTSATGIAVHGIALVATVGLVGERAGGFERLGGAVPPAALLAAAAVVVGVVVAVTLSPFGQRRLQPALSEAVTSLVATLHRPRQALTLLVGAIGVTLSYVGALAASARAFDIQLPFVEVALVYLAAGLLASAAPTPGQLGAAEAALAAGFLTLGVATGPAVAAVLTFRLVTFWLPIGPGFLALRWLRARAIL